MLTGTFVVTRARSHHHRDMIQNRHVMQRPLQAMCEQAGLAESPPIWDSPSAEKMLGTVDFKSWRPGHWVV